MTSDRQRPIRTLHLAKDDKSKQNDRPTERSKTVERERESLTTRNISAVYMHIGYSNHVNVSSWPLSWTDRSAAGGENEATLT